MLCSLPKENCNTFDDLRYILYTKKNKMVISLQPTSNMSHGDILRSHYVVLICSSLILAPDTNLNPVNWVGIQYWCPINVLLHYQRCVLLLMAVRKNALEDVSASSLALHAQKLASTLKNNAARKFTNRLNWKMHRICKYKSFLWAKFSRIWIKGHIQENTN